MDVTALSKLRNPPIVEAVVDFDCDMPLHYDLSKEHDRIKQDLFEDYPNVEPIHKTAFSFQFDPALPKSEIEQSLEAIRFRSQDSKQIVQYRNSGFSFNRLAPYSSYEDYAGEILDRWMQFVQLANPVVLRTLRLRYINSLNLPIAVGGKEYQKYLNCAVVLEGDGFRSDDFLLRLNVASDTEPINGVVVSVAQPRTRTHSPVTLDVAVQMDVACEVDDVNAIQSSLESLRRFKNRLFASVITSDLLALLENQI